MTAQQPVQFVAAYGTNVGLKRTLNEDAFLAQFPVFVVADGMGGHQAGEVASATAINAVSALVHKPNVVAADVIEAVQAAQMSVSHLSEGLDGGAGTTLTGVVAVRFPPWGLSWLILNIGDSRTYRRVGAGFERLTTDHSHVQELVDSGQITEDEALRHPSRNVITKALGDGFSEADFWISPLMPGERVVVLSDGATESVLDSELLAAVSAPEPQTAVAAVIEQALRKGGSDNITVIVVDVLAAEDAGGERFAPGLTQLPATVRLDPEDVLAQTSPSGGPLPPGGSVEPGEDNTQPSSRK